MYSVSEKITNEQSGGFLFRAKFITGASLRHHCKTTKTPRARIFSEKRDGFIFYEKTWWEPLFSELDNAHLLEYNSGERGEGWREREDVFTSGHRESRVVWERGDVRHAMQTSQAPPRADLLTGTENWVTIHDTSSKRRLGSQWILFHLITLYGSATLERF